MMIMNWNYYIHTTHASFLKGMQRHLRNSSETPINPLVAFYDSHGRKREVLFFDFVQDTNTRLLHWK
jgi:hypothetical protein